MRIAYDNRDVLETPQGFYLTSMVNEEGVPVDNVSRSIFEAFGTTSKIRDMETEFDSGECMPIDNVFVFALNTEASDNTKYDELETALRNIRYYCSSIKVNKLSFSDEMFINAGYEWNKVHYMIANEFADTNIDVLICTENNRMYNSRIREFLSDIK